jgi:hypothetical protein
MAKSEAKIKSQAVGAYGEKVVEAELLRCLWVPANVNASIKNAADFDIFALKNGRTVHIRVKTCGPNVKEFQFNSPRGQKIVTNGFSDVDFTVLVSMGKTRNEDEFYIVPTSVVRVAVSAHREHYLAQLKRNGEKRIDNGQWSLRLRDSNSKDPSYGFEKKWQQYKSNWLSLEHPAKQPH